MSSETSSELLRGARAAIQVEHVETALNLAERALNIAPRNAEGLMLLGVCKSLLGENEEATQALRKSVALDGTNAEAWYNLGQHYYSVGQTSEAARCAKESLALDPTNRQAEALLHELNEASDDRGPLPDYYVVPEVPEEAKAHLDALYEMAREKPVHSLAWVDKLGQTWTHIAYAVLGVTTACEFVTMYLNYTHVKDMILKGGVLNSDSIFKIFAASQGSGLVQILSLVATLGKIALVIWLVCDILDRRSNWWFLLLCLCLPAWISMPIYIFAGRPVFPPANDANRTPG